MKNFIKQYHGYFLQMLGVIMIVFGLYLISKPFVSIYSKDNSIASASIDVSQTETIDNTDDGNILEGLFVERASAATLSAMQKSSINNAQMEIEGRWIATDYESGDISHGSYTVQRGDTLWEIAEAVYGSGQQWHKILDANSAQIGFLPNGSQAMIISGQVLTVPAP